MANRDTSLDDRVHSFKDLQHYGSERMTKACRDYYNEGSMDLITVRLNESAYDRYMIRPRVLRNTSNLDPSTTIFGTKVKFPFGISPTAMQTLAHPEGENGVSKGCAKSDTLMALSSYSTIELEKVISHRQINPYVMQISLLKSKPAMIQMIRRAEVAGYNALFVILDCPYLGRRLNEYRNKFNLPAGTSFPNFFPGVDVANLQDGDETMSYDDTIEWPEIIPFFREHTSMEIWAKGIYTVEDALLAVESGFNGIIVSNHGGRQLDGVPATLDALREIVPDIKGKVPIAIDGGIRRGSDIFKALAIGADFCMAGRPALWSLAYNGEEGVKLAIDLLYRESVLCMGLSGCRTISDISSASLSILENNGRLSKL
ncbi:hypothetical protein PENSTE_c010G09614 [Penicillium steckii]|uniref:Oxidase FUB9 n=1 Tax=Penicillium steckii TaxID=303698 RepID=A0A1V6TAA3_9EURO|nr:hypothetical protein PENSTE_c010G09614 [Penicillium steckii]